MEIIQDFIPKGRRNRPGYSMTPQYNTAHNTGNSSRGAGALAHARYIKSDHAASRPASWHFTVDDTYIVQHLPLFENGWHAGDGGKGPGNRTSIGIEIAENSDSDYEKAQYNAAWLCAYLMRTGVLHPMLVADLHRQHWDWSGKNCPWRIRREKNGWKNFLGDIEKHLRKSAVELEKEAENEEEPLTEEEVAIAAPGEMPPDFLPPDIDREPIGDDPTDWQDSNVIPSKPPLFVFDQYRQKITSRIEGVLEKPTEPRKIRPLGILKPRRWGNIL